MNHLLLQKTIKLLQQGGIIAYPTEAVFGLGCDPLNEAAVHKILTIKNRSIKKGLILIAADFHQLQPYLAELPAELFDRVMQTWPGPTTWLLPVNINAPAYLRGKHSLQAVRVSNHPVVREICNAFGSAIVSTSANLSNRPPARTALQVRLHFQNQIDLIINQKTGKQREPCEIKNALTNTVVRQGDSGEKQ